MNLKVKYEWVDGNRRLVLGRIHILVFDQYFLVKSRMDSRKMCKSFHDIFSVF